MATTGQLPSGNDLQGGIAVRSAADVGAIARMARKSQGLSQLDLAGLGNTGNRFIVELEAGKPTLQLQKALDTLALLGLEVLVRRKGGP
jgi:HTH-type transcriptional regulator / antitoxin HipB